MTDDPKKLPDGEALATAAMTTLGAYATGASTPQAVFLGALAAIPMYVMPALQWGVEELTDRWALFNESVRTKRGLPPHSEPFTPEEMGDPNVRKAVFETLQQVMSLGERCVIPAIGRLTEEYVSARRRPDEFFRGLGRVLSALSCEEFAVLRRFVATVAALDVAELVLDDGMVALDYWTKEVPIPVVRCTMLPRDAEGGWHPIGEFGDIRRLFYLMKNGELGKEGRAGGFGASSGPHRIDLDPTLIRRVAAIIGPPD